MYICPLIGIFTYLFGAYLKTGNKPAFIYLDLFDKLAKTGKYSIIIICNLFKNWRKKKDSRFRMSPARYAADNLSAIRRPFDQHPTIGRIHKSCADCPSRFPLRQVLVGLLKVFYLINLHLLVSGFANCYPICLWPNHSTN